MQHESLSNLWSLLVSNLTDRLASGEATTQDLTVARQLLKDHGVNVDKPEESPLATLNDILPFSTSMEKPASDEAESA